MACEGDFGSLVLDELGPRPIGLAFCTWFSIPAPPCLGLTVDFKPILISLI